ncbi:MAG: DUF2812 domain-containing protein [Coriobacteriales bacterium]|jgi:hypothetical protein|nr:DUF2812 domain-containing protein [Coriobacteriales bacterium]
MISNYTYNGAAVPVKVKWQSSIDPGEHVTFINKMSAEGWKLVAIEWGARFVFVPCWPGEYLCQAAFTVKNSGFFDYDKYQRIAEMLAESGAEIVAQRNTLGSRCALYAVRKASYGPFEINSDIDSKIEDYRLRRNYYLSFAFCFLAFCLTYASLATTSGFPWLLGLPWLCLALSYAYPAQKYQRILKRLKAERDVSEV